MNRRRFVLLVLVVGVAVAGWKGWSLYQSLLEGGRAQRSGEMPLPGLGVDVVVQVDKWGVPYLSAESLEDLVRAMGWVHANDRFAQMELNRRVASARLSEVIGEAGLEMDREMLDLQVRSIAERAVAGMRPDSLELLKVYADGVNAWLLQRGDDLQPLFQLTGVKPEPWTPTDSMCVPAMLAVSLSFINKRVEEERYQVLRELGVDAAMDWIGEEVPVPEGLLDLPYEPEWKKEGVALSQPSPADAMPGGSNNWAVAGSLTEHGSALVANDPHLGLRLPSIWYQIHLRSPQLEVAGMSIAGVPGVVLGHNQNLAWAFTNVMLDDHDLLFEQVSNDGKKVRRGDEWVDVVEKVNQIKLKNGDTVEWITASTDLGPMLPPDPERGLPARTLLWSAYHLDDPLTPFLNLARAKTVEQAITAANQYQAPTQNIVIGHTDGSIAWTMFGRPPARPRQMGRLPSPAWDASYHWNSLAESANNPRIAPGERQTIITANALLEGVGESLQADYDTPFRAQRIAELLAAGPASAQPSAGPIPREGSNGSSGSPTPWAAASLAAPQNDVTDGYALHLLSKLPQKLDNSTADRLLGKLRAWDGVNRVEGMAAFFWLFERKLWQGIFGDELKKHHLPMPWTFLQRQKLLRVVTGNAKYNWVDNVDTEAVETLNDIVREALIEAWNEGLKDYGEDMNQWAYGRDLHHWSLPHHLDAVPILGGQFTRGPYALPGSATSVNAMGGANADWKKVVWGPSMRVVWDTGNWDNSRAIIPGGQSGHFADPNYDDQIPLFLNGELRTVPWSPRAIDAAKVQVITLTSSTR